ncbi:hypothetical protein I4U23_015376 [Adineta vaga]|nr:hypothetical protein I4U23_015376 [Adineta vaga]
MVTKQNTISILSLPTELLHRICDFLDTKTIVQSFRHVCMKLFAITETYNRYKIRINSVTMINICRFIPSENVLQLEFENEHSTITNIHRFTRLQSLTIHRINVNDAKLVLQHAARNCKLMTFSIDLDGLQNIDDLLYSISEITTQSTLRKLILNFDLDDIEKFSWPHSCRITTLSIGTCTFKQFASILQNSPHLHTLMMNNCWKIDIDETFLTQSYLQLNSLTFNDLQMTMDKLEYCLGFLPSLIHLDLTSSGKPFEFIQRLSQWEEFLRLRLPRLSQLEICIFCYCCDWNHFDAIINAFRTPFWLEEKQWFITCQFRDDWTSSFTFFTSPESSSVQYTKEKHHFDRIVCSNLRDKTL